MRMTFREEQGEIPFKVGYGIALEGDFSLSPEMIKPVITFLTMYLRITNHGS